MTTRSVPLALDALSREAGVYGGLIHGDDPSGAWDVEFPSVVKAANFAHVAHRHTGWRIDLREGDTVATFHTSVTVTVRPEVAP